MKKIIVLAICALCAMTAWGQTLINYTYDDAGNRIKREPAVVPLVQTMSATATAMPLFEWAEPISFQPLALGAVPAVYQPPKALRTAIDTSLPVGRTEGASGVSPTGAATYQIPIKVSAGVGGMQPQISVAYSSQSGNGLMGWGWNLSATSAITRIGKNFYYDGKAEELKLDATDNLMLDGKRLMLTTGTNLATGSVYAPEMEDHSIAEHLTIGGYNAFRVRTADGMKYEYGTTADSYIKAQNSTVALCWLLSKVSDRFGNTMLYHYDTNFTTGEAYLSNIEYNIGTTPGHRVEFLYSTRNDVIEGYSAGNVVAQKRLLTSIKCINKTGTVMKEYRFKYSLDQNYSKLNEVEEYGLNGDRYNSTIIDWGDSRGEYSKTSHEDYIYLNTPRQGDYPECGDFNGDGLADMMDQSDTEATLYLGYSQFGVPGMTKKCSIPLGDNFKGLVYVDHNGDGKMDAIRINGNLLSYQYYYFTFNGESFNTSNIITTTASGDKRVTTGDFNGDGKTELLVGGNKLYGENGTVTSVSGITNWGTEYLSVYPNNKFVVDFNGDGKADVLTMNANNSWVYTLNGNTFTQLASFNNSGLRNNYFNYFGDFNGDGKTDVLCQSSSIYSEVFLYLSNGRSFVKKQITGHDIEAKLMVGDTNRDGKDEIIHLDPPTTLVGKIRIKVGSFNGTGFETEYYTSAQMTYNLIRENIGSTQSNIAVQDFDGDGRVEYALFGYTDMGMMLAFNDKLNLSVKTIQDGYNTQVSFQYAPITAGAGYIETTQTVAYPLAKMKLPLEVVTAKTTSTMQNSQMLGYAYKDLIVHRQGKGLMGFRNVEETDYARKMKTINTYSVNTTCFAPYLSLQEIKTTDGKPVHESYYVYSANLIGNKRYRLLPFMKAELDCLTRSTVVSAYSNYDTYGNPQLVRKYVDTDDVNAAMSNVVQKYLQIGFGIDGKEVENQTLSYHNFVSSDLRYIGLPTSQTVTNVTDGASYIKE